MVFKGSINLREKKSFRNRFLLYILRSSLTFQTDLAFESLFGICGSIDNNKDISAILSSLNGYHKIYRLTYI